MIALGSKVTDKITGFTGIVTGRSEYISGYKQVLVVPPVDKDGKIDGGAWLEVGRLTIDETAVPVTLA